VSINVGVTVENEGRIRPQQEGGLEFLRNAQEQKLWQVDFAGVADAMGVSEEEAQRAVALFNANCARCHTSGFSAGVPYTQEVGSGGFGPALWKGRELIQFGEAPTDPKETDLLIDFLTKGSQADTAYGINGDGSGRMPAFGEVLSSDDLALLARYLRTGILNGIE
jgi:mono/diheme cytochrome c family protein